MKLCNNCGLPVSDDEDVCPECGNPSFASVPPAEDEPPPPTLRLKIRDDITDGETPKGSLTPPPRRSRPLLIFLYTVLASAIAGVLFGLLGYWVSISPLIKHPLVEVRQKDGDPPKFEVASRKIQEVINNEVKNLKPGQILFNPAQEMKVGETETVEVRIAKSVVDDLAKGLKGKGAAQIEQIKVSAYMGVVLNGTEGFFNITLKNREQKIITDGEYTEWIFDVTPLKQGNPSLYLTAYNVINTPTGEKTYEHPAFSREIKVTTTLTYTIVTFLKDNWDKVIGIIIASGIAGLIITAVKKIRGKRKGPRTWEKV